MPVMVMQQSVNVQQIPINNNNNKSAITYDSISQNYNQNIHFNKNNNLEIQNQQKHNMYHPNIQINGNTISFEKIPVDVYLKNDDYYVDFENIKY